MGESGCHDPKAGRDVRAAAMSNITVWILQVLQRQWHNRILTMRTGLAKGLKRRYGMGFKPKLALTAEERFLKSLDFAQKTVFDVGGYVGILTLFFSRAVGDGGQVVTFEPNPANFEELFYNVRLNRLSNVTLLPIALGRESRKMTLMVDRVYPSRGTLAENLQEDFLKRGNARSVQVEVDSLDNQMRLRSLPSPDLVKIDVEGFEKDVLYGMAQTIQAHKPDLFIEIHGVMHKEIAEHLLSAGYSIYHVESGAHIVSSDSPMALGHLFCTGTIRPRSD
jgi:FkbM family methyltransferase